MILVFAVNFLSALWILSRTWHDSALKWRKWVGFLTIPLTVFVARSSPLIALMLLHLPTLSTPLVERWQKWRELQSISTQLRELVENVILSMRSGKSFRTALQ